MHVFSLRPLRGFWEKYPEAERPLRAWYKTTSKAEWKNFEDVKRTYSSADRARQFTIFDIGGNKCRLITVIHYGSKDTSVKNRTAGKVYVAEVFTHEEYDAWNEAQKKSKKKR